MGTKPNKTPVGTFAVLALVGAALLSGCAGLGGAEDEVNLGPRAQLDVDKTEGWAGEQFTFDAQASKDPDGNITQWRFDFGDGTQTTVTEDDAARVKHTYAEGGEYIATLTVVDDGHQDGTGEETDKESVHIAVDERMPVAASVVRTPLDTDAGAMMALPFEAREGADRVRANVTLQNTLPTGSSELKLVVRDPSGNVTEEKSYTLSSTSPEDVEFSVLLTDIGNHTFEVVAESGSGRVTGELQIIYSDVPDVDKLQDQADEEA